MMTESVVERLVEAVERLQAERAALKPAPPAPVAPGGNVVPIEPTEAERAAALERANAPVPEHIRDTRPKDEPWRGYIDGDGNIMSRPGTKFWGPIGS
jgi:hypothetical protein